MLDDVTDTLEQSAAAGSRRPGRRGSFAVAAAPGLVTAVLGAVALSRGHGLWYDELFSYEVARLPLDTILSAAWHGHGTTPYLVDAPPSYQLLWYLLAHLWLGVAAGLGDLSLRVFALAAGATGVAVLTAAVSRLGGRAVGLVAGLAVATNPLLLAWVVEARSYGVAVLATSLAALGLARWLDGRRGGLVLFAVAGAAAGAAHWYSVLVVGGLVLAATVLHQPGRRAALLAGALAALPTAGLVLLNRTDFGGRNADVIPDTHGLLLLVAARDWAGASVPLAVVVAGLALAGLALPGPGRLKVVAVCWVLVPCAVLTALERWRPVYIDRYLLTTMLGLGMLSALGVVGIAAAVARALRHRPAAGHVARGVLVGLAAVLIGLSAVVSAGLRSAPPKERADEAAALIAALHTAGQPVVADDHRSALGLDHYTRTRFLPLRADLLLPPLTGVPERGSVLWYVAVPGVPSDTQAVDGAVLLMRAGWHVDQEWSFPATFTSLVVQRWTR